MAALSDIERLIEIFPPVIRLWIKGTFTTDRFHDDDRVSLMLDPDPSQVCTFRWNDVNLVIDHPAREGRDSVFPPHPESLYLAHLIPSPFGEGKFLDVGVGAGILSICAAKQGWKVIGIDPNERATRLAALNCRLNDVSASIVLDATAASFQTGEIDLCLANLPFEPTPLGKTNYIHSSGGLRGEDVIRNFLPIVSKILRPGGIAVIPAFSLLHANGKSLFAEALSEASLGELERILVRLSLPISLDTLAARFRVGTAKKAFPALAQEGYKDFVIECGVLRLPQQDRPCSLRLGFAQLLQAGKYWVLPTSFGRLAKPAQ
jgi:SAM-dependent methyltransferase